MPYAAHGSPEHRRCDNFFARHRSPLLGAMVIACASALRAAPVEGMLTPRLSPDGEWIAVAYQGMIAKVRRTGGPLTLLTREEGWAGDPAWSPDGTRLAYLHGPVSRPGPTVHIDGALRVIDAATGARVALPNEVEAIGPIWFHPDGRRLLARFGRGPATRFGWLDLATGRIAPASLGERDARIAQHVSTPYALSDDGTSIVFAVHQDVPGHQSGDEGPQADLFRAPAGGGAAELIARFPARIYELSPGGRNRGVYAVTDLGTSHNDVWHIGYAGPAREATSSPSARPTNIHPRPTRTDAGSSTPKTRPARRG